MFSREMLLNLLIVFVSSLVLQLAVIGLCYLAFCKSYDDPKSRVCTVASACGNVGFFGVPMLQALLPDNPEAIIYSAVFIVSMNIIGWTLGMYILSRDKKHISIKKFLLNPTTLILLLALPLFFSKAVLPTVLMSWVTFFAKMATPLAMTILGMRFASANMAELFKGYKQYIAISVKLVIFPLVTYLILMPFNFDPILKASIFILSAMPPAAISLNFAEITDTAPKTAASIVLIGSLLCIITLPLLMLLM
ncbi:MAG: AEC family transporter, partial [Clostridia bacterium]